MKALILGAGGMAGHVMANYFLDKGHTVMGFARRKLPFCDTITGNALDMDAVKQAVDSQYFDAIINCIGVLNQDVDNNIADGIYLNSYLPHYLAQYTEKTQTKVIHLSTDCVFSGHGSGEYQENSIRDADTLYGRSKALGEINDKKNLTFRTSIIGPDININGVGLFNWFMKQSGSIFGYTSAIWTGVSTIILAKAVEKAVIQDLTGLYHLVNNEVINKYDLLVLFNRLRAHPVTIVPEGKVAVNKSLIDTRKDFDFTVPGYEEMVDDMGKWIASHRELYSHYV